MSLRTVACHRVSMLRKESLEFRMKMKAPQTMVSNLGTVGYLRESLADVLAPRAFVSL